MIQTSTHNEIIRYLYKETSEEENKLIESDFLFNEEARVIYQDLAFVKRSLDKGFKTPGKRVIENVLNYSKSLNLRTVPNPK
ncbi:MAG TPA: hypothetical protein VD908_02250 [Cytophagales bacterium]|nr:hypothetical protein [Cytophagales bacterium]